MFLNMSSALPYTSQTFLGMASKLLDTRGMLMTKWILKISFLYWRKPTRYMAVTI